MEKLNCKSLMIGDWVYRPDCFDQVKEIRQNGIIGLDSARGLIPFLELEPIPLIPEILEKNGFILKEGEEGRYGVTIAPYYTRDDVPFEVFCDGEPFAIWFKDPVNIEYVHELQHALRLCGITREIII